MRLLSCLLLLAAMVPGQQLADILPFGLRLDDGGKLAWNPTAPTACRLCAGKKLVPCPRCSQSATPCGLCKDRMSPCRGCGATGTALDPFVEIVCPGCSGTQHDVCPTCSGRATVVAPDGREAPCGGCRGRRSFPCVDCGGSGRLPLGSSQVHDLRALDLAAALARRDELRAWTRRIGQRRAEVARAGDPAREMGALLDEARPVLDLPAGSAERLLALAAAAVGENASSDREYGVSQRAATLERRIEAEASRLDTCIWRHRRNAGELERIADGPLASAVRWQFPFGEDPQRKDVLWLVLGRGFMRAPESADVGEVVAAWLAAHPQALLQPIARLEDVGRAPRTATWIHCRVVDGEHDLALHLVEKGCVPAGVLAALREEFEGPIAAQLAYRRRANELEAAAKAKKLGVWHDENPAADEGLAAAHKLREARDHRAAIAQYEKALAAGADRKEAWTCIGECRLALADFAAARQAFDEALAAGATWDARRGKARAIGLLDGEAAAAAFLRTLELEPHDFERWLGELCRELGKVESAIAHYEKSVELASTKHAFVFDAEGWLTVDEATRKKENNDFADLWPTLEDVAELCFRQGDDRKAMRFATMGVAIGQQLNRCKGYYDATEIAAGDVDCRVLRGRLLCKQGRLDDAETEERLARTLANRSGYTGYQQRLQVLREEIAARRRR